ncbi:hypothetical protein DFR70_101819 [Nocardia tenerifensis]|uniref:Uncharacterized protein n=1 Tax=Nocardia tenerifensis TaxID=228006 RepID=A0A318KBX5_9NOCA|nr:hypothetical protein [Nocardia tenerifensis]PXX71397.1 hypothetical protein DFR70_101819 [Nocardia tenerifensis]
MKLGALRMGVSIVALVGSGFLAIGPAHASEASVTCQEVKPHNGHVDASGCDAGEELDGKAAELSNEKGDVVYYCDQVSMEEGEKLLGEMCEKV